MILDSKIRSQTSQPSRFQASFSCKISTTDSGQLLFLCWCRRRFLRCLQPVGILSCMDIISTAVDWRDDFGALSPGRWKRFSPLRAWQKCLEAVALGKGEGMIVTGAPQETCMYYSILRKHFQNLLPCLSSNSSCYQICLSHTSHRVRGTTFVVAHDQPNILQITVPPNLLAGAMLVAHWMQETAQTILFFTAVKPSWRPADSWAPSALHAPPFFSNGKMARECKWPSKCFGYPALL